MPTALFDVRRATMHLLGVRNLMAPLAALAIAAVTTPPTFAVRERQRPTRNNPGHALLTSALLSLLLVGCSGSETDPVDTATLLPQELGDWVKQADPVTFDRETIFDHINGAGEVYRSYAFDHVIVARYQNPQGLAVIVELFDMGNPADAYGVFSYALEQEKTGIGAAYEPGGSVLCFWQDRFYICVAAQQQEPDPAPLVEEIARGISQRLPTPGTRPALVDMLPSEGLRPLSQRYFHLHQTLNYHFYLVRDNILNLSPATKAVLGRYQPGATILLIIDYGDEPAARDTLASFRQFAQHHASPEAQETQAGETARQTVSTTDWKYLASVQLGRFLIVALNGEDEAAVQALLEAASDNLREAGI
ncbi:MAG: DUF6599 family protein [Phycisphaerales bacterium JB038]